MGFWNEQQVNITKRYLRWQFERHNQPLPAESELDRQARAVVDQARQVARRTGRNVLAIVKELVQQVRKKQ